MIICKRISKYTTDLVKLGIYIIDHYNVLVNANLVKI